MLMVSSCGTNESKENIDSIVEKMFEEEDNSVFYHRQMLKCYSFTRHHFVNKT
jgi:hypothetical protein